MRCALAAVLILSVVGLPVTSSSQIVPPKPGVDMPQAYFDRVKEDPHAFQFRHAWIDKTRRIRLNRELLLRKGMADIQLSPASEEGTAVSGTFNVPVFLTKFNNTPSDPYPSSDLQTELFDGPWPTGTMTQFYSEISYGNLNLNGTVYNWFQLSQNDTYYEGTQNGLGSDSKVGELLKETLDNWDPSVDFGQYDNDGPDGVPNSGDDDGYVDFVSFVHAESGGECGNSNIWSHRWYYGGWWGGNNYVTNDPRTGGGFIRVSDYTIQPALACDNTTMIQIGVFCHEFGHAFGLPDLYDTNGGSQGIGHWGLMGSGNWNTPSSPAHMSAWSKSELGWLSPVVVGSAPALYSIRNSELNPEAYALVVPEKRWRRLTLCALSGSYSLHLGLTSSEASTRDWPLGQGYGNGWNERVVREFGFDGSTPVTLSYDYAYKTESGFDYWFVKIRVNGTEYTVRTYSGISSGSESGINLSSYLSGSGATSYEIIFEFTSDYAYSDEDGDFDSSCNGPVTVDNIGLTGGGESYFTDFESYLDGWHDEGIVGMGYAGGNEEYFLVENREPFGFDKDLHGPGLLVWHVNEDVANTYIGNSGGSSNNQTRGVQVMEADGLWQMLNNLNRGDAGDVFPGSSSNTLFDNSTNPSSKSSENQASNVVISSISAAGSTMTAIMSGGMYLPTVTSITPSTGDNGSGVIHIDAILGTAIQYGSTFLFRDSLGGERMASSVEWVDYKKLEGDIDLTALIPGRHDVVVVRPDGEEGVLVKGFTVTGATGISSPGIPDSYALYQNHPNPFNPVTTIPFDIKEHSHVDLKVYDVEGKLVRTVLDEMLEPRHYDILWDGRDEKGAEVSSGVYFYRIRAGDFIAVRKMVLLK